MWMSWPVILCDTSLISCLFLSAYHLCWLEKRDRLEEEETEEHIALQYHGRGR
jgi:hypothetical protein